MTIYSVVLLLHTVATVICAAILSLIDTDIFTAYDFITATSFHAFYDYIQACAFLLFGSVVSESLLIKLTFAPVEKNEFHIFTVNSATKVATVLLIADSFVIILAIVLGFLGGQELLFRTHYGYEMLPGSFLELLLNSLKQPIGLLPILTLSLLPKGATRAFAINLLAAILSWIYLYANGTKFTAVVILIYALVAIHRKHIKPQFGLFLVLVSFFVFVLVLTQRTLNIYGLLSFPMIAPEIISRSRDAMEFALEVASSPVYIASETKAANLPDLQNLWIELTPLGGSASGWYEISDAQRINPAIPFSGIGTLASYGSYAVFIYGIFCGICSNILFRAITIINQKAAIFSAVLFAIFHVSIFTQYNLRSATRWLYYEIAASLFLFLCHYLFIQKRE